jgi:lipase chaperone LimK
MQAGKNLSYQREQRGLRSLGSRRAAKPKTTISDSAQNMFNNGDYAKDFARESKRISTKRGLTKSQRKAQTGALKTRMAVESGNLTGDAAEQALDLSRESTRKGLTRSQRVGLAGASETLLEAAGGDIDTASDFEQSLLKFFEV